VALVVLVLLQHLLLLSETDDICCEYHGAALRKPRNNLSCERVCVRTHAWLPFS
jgi:hypothetical protein